MNNMQKMGGYATLALGVQYVVLTILMLGWLEPSFHMYTNMMAEADKGALPVLDNFSPTLSLIENLVSVLFTITFLLSALALRERLAGAQNRMRIAMIATSVASALSLGSITISLIGLPPIVATNDLSAFQVLSMVIYGLAHAAVFSYGWTTLLWGWAGLSTKSLPSGLSYVLMLAGVFAVLEIGMIVLEPLGLAINVVWSFWLGYVLLMRPGKM